MKSLSSQRPQPDRDSCKSPSKASTLPCDCQSNSILGLWITTTRPTPLTLRNRNRLRLQARLGCDHRSPPPRVSVVAPMGQVEIPAVNVNLSALTVKRPIPSYSRETDRVGRRGTAAEKRLLQAKCSRPT